MSSGHTMRIACTLLLLLLVPLPQLPPQLSSMLLVLSPDPCSASCGAYCVKHTPSRRAAVSLHARMQRATAWVCSGAGTTSFPRGAEREYTRMMKLLAEGAVVVEEDEEAGAVAVPSLLLLLLLPFSDGCSCSSGAIAPHISRIHSDHVRYASPVNCAILNWSEVRILSR